MNFFTYKRCTHFIRFIPQYFIFCRFFLFEIAVLRCWCEGDRFGSARCPLPCNLDAVLEFRVRARLSAPPAFAGLPHVTDLIALCKNYILFSLIFCIVILFSISLFSSLTFFLFLFFLFILNHTFCNLPRFRLGFCRSFSNLSI